MTSTPALRLVSPTLQADVGGISATPGPRQLVVDGEASLRLRKKIGNDSYSALEVLFILADVTPSGVVVHSATERLQDSLGWGRDKVRNTLKRLQDQGYIARTQETVTDPDTGKLIFGRGVLTLEVAAVDVIGEDQVPQDTPTPPEGWGVWGRPLAPEVAAHVLASWGVRGVDRLWEHDPVLVSDAVKFVQNALRTGVPIENPGAYVRKLIVNRRVAAPDPSVPPELLSDELTLADLVGSSPTEREGTVERARAARAHRRNYLDALLRTGIPAEVRAEIELLVEDDMRGFTFTDEEAQQVYRYHLLEERLAERGLLAGPPPEEPDEEIDPEAPPF